MTMAKRKPTDAARGWNATGEYHEGAPLAVPDLAVAERRSLAEELADEDV